MGVNDDLEALYHFTGNTTDDSGNSNVLNNTGATLTTDKNSVGNQAFDYDGTNDYMNSTDLTSWMSSFGTTDKSWSLWFNADSVSGYHAVTATMISGNSPQCALLDLVGAGNIMRMILRDNNGNDVQFNGSGTISSGTWYHYVGTWDATAKTAKMYLDKLEIGSATNVSSGSFSNMNIGLQLGSRLQGTTRNGYFNGKIDEVRFYDQTLSQADIDELFDGYDDVGGSGYSNKINGVVPAKVNGIDGADISKVNGI